MNRTLLSVVALIVASFAIIVAFARQPQPVSVHRLQRIKSSGVIKVGYILNEGQVDMDPSTGALTGFHVELLEAIAAGMHTKLEYEETTFSTMVAGLRSGTHDIVIGGGYISITRASEIEFSDPLCFIGLGIVVRKSNSKITNTSDLSAPGTRIAATAGGASADYVATAYPNAKPVLVTKKGLPAVVLELLSGRADAAVGNSANCEDIAAQHDDILYITEGEFLAPFPSGLALPPNSDDWGQFINTCIMTLRANGTLARLNDKYNANGSKWKLSLP